MTKAHKSNWKTKSMPAKHKILSIERAYSPIEFEKIQVGLIPDQMEDKWFIYFEDDQLYCHRSWTGYCIYIVVFELRDSNYHISKVLVNRNKKQYQEIDNEWDKNLLLYMIDSMLLGKQVEFPERGSEDEDKDILERWSIEGRNMLGGEEEEK